MGGRHSGKTNRSSPPYTRYAYPACNSCELTSHPSNWVLSSVRSLAPVRNSWSSLDCGVAVNLLDQKYGNENAHKTNVQDPRACWMCAGGLWLRNSCNCGQRKTKPRLPAAAPRNLSRRIGSERLEYSRGPTRSEKISCTHGSETADVPWHSHPIAWDLSPTRCHHHRTSRRFARVLVPPRLNRERAMAAASLTDPS